MNANTLKAVIKHGNAILAAFPNASERDPLALCRKLRRIETSLEKPMVAYCNGEIDYQEVDKIKGQAWTRLVKLLGVSPHYDAIFINTDPRGYALKIDNETESGAALIKQHGIYTDFGGYGILAPDLTTK